MRINEIFDLKWYKCQVRIIDGGINQVVTTGLSAINRQSAIALLAKQFGRSNVISCIEMSNYIAEVDHQNTKTQKLTADQLKVKSIENKVDSAKRAGDRKEVKVAKAELAFQKSQIKRNKAQDDLTKKSSDLTQARDCHTPL